MVTKQLNKIYQCKFNTTEVRAKNPTKKFAESNNTLSNFVLTHCKQIRLNDYLFTGVIPGL